MKLHGGRRLRLIAALAATLAGAPAYAHDLLIEAYPVGDAIEGSAYFSDGTLVKNQPIEVVDKDGRRVGVAQTDARGNYSYKPTAAEELRFRVDMGSGHVSTATVAVGDVAAVIGGGSGSAAAAPAGGPTTPAATPAAVPVVLDAAVRQQIATSIRDRIRPLRTDLGIYGAGSSYPVVLGGIGFIVGLAGLAFYIYAGREPVRRS